MIITDPEILDFIRKSYQGYENYSFKNKAISVEKEFIIVKDIHEINEDELDITKDIFIRNLQPSRQTNSINVINICDSVNAESYGSEEKIYSELEKYNKSYTRAFLRNCSRWVDLGAFNLTCEKAKEILGNRNPRTLFNVSKYTYLLNNNILNTANLRLSVVDLQSCIELMHLEIRKMNYDMIMRPVTTINGKVDETLVKTKYVNNFFLHHDLHFDHEFVVFGTIAGLVARKNNGGFGKIRAYYYQFDLLKLLKTEYAYLNLTLEVKGDIHSPVFVNGRQIAHKVILKRKKVLCHFSNASKWTGKMLARYEYSKETDIYDYENPVELSTITPESLSSVLESGEAMLVYKIDETLFDSYSIYDTINPLSGIVVEKGEYFNASHNLFGVTYENKRAVWNLWGFAEHILLFSKTLQSDKLQRIKLFDSMMQQQRNAMLRAEQAERLVREKEESNERIRELNATLQEKVKERTLQLEKLNEQQRMNFINLVHETKTPLTLINNYLEEYIRKHKMTEELEVVKSALSKLTRDMNSIFDLERFNKGLEVYRNNQITNFSKTLNETLVLFEFYCKKQNHGCDSEIEEDIFIKADPNAVNRVINNLLENAIKFSPPNSRLSVKLKSEGDKIFFIVADEGKGIARSFQKKIFEPYFQIGQQIDGVQGMGLGLPIVKKVIESLDATIKIDSDPANRPGTVVTVVFNKHLIEPKEDASTSPSITPFSVYNIENFQFNKLPHVSGRKVILVVEDNRAMLNYLYKKLSSKYNVLCALNGAEAINLLQGTTAVPDLIVSDVMMDKVDGFTFADILAKNDRFKHIPLIFLTALNNHQEKLKGLSLGAIDWFCKPYSFEELKHKAESVLAKVSQTRIRNLIDGEKNNEGYRSDTSNSSREFEESCKVFRLTQREIEIAKLVKQGHTYEEIADTLFVSKKTVSNHVTNMYEKLQVSSKTQLLQKLNEVSVGSKP